MQVALITALVTPTVPMLVLIWSVVVVAVGIWLLTHPTPTSADAGLDRLHLRYNIQI